MQGVGHVIPQAQAQQVVGDELRPVKHYMGKGGSK